MAAEEHIEMQCTHCTDHAPVRVGGSQTPRCDTCHSLYSAKDWDGLALRWLQHRPEDWVSDVATFLEAVSGIFLPPKEVSPSAQAMLASHIDPGPSDWLTS